MEKIKINLMSGSSLEKPLITAFKSNGGSYVVFDNEINGTMGLPIILVSKIENNKLAKIFDQNEWNAVKESLRMIIAGNQVDYITVDAAMLADDVFFSQLTLPVASFETLKSNYKPTDTTLGVGSINQNDFVTPVQPTNVATNSIPDTASVLNIEQPMAQSTVGPLNGINNMNVSSSPVENTIEIGNSPEMAAPAVEPVAPVMPNAPVDNQVQSQVISEAPNVEPIPETVEAPIDFTADKEAFLKACENMFDALVAKFKN